MESLEKRYNKWLSQTQYTEFKSDGKIICCVCKQPISKGVDVAYLKTNNTEPKKHYHHYSKMINQNPKETYECSLIRYS